MEKVVLDIWGGECSCDHVARFIRPADEALRMAATDLAKGYLVNLRATLAWGGVKEFDERCPN